MTEDNIISSSKTSFASSYWSLRRKEKRNYSDEELRALPYVPSHSAHAGEWKMREHSVRLLTRYLRKFQRPLHIAEIGCGNGWLSNRLAGIKEAMVTGLDPNPAEIAQAQRVFPPSQALHFIEAEFPAGISIHSQDIVLFASSFQYFESAESTILQSLACLKKGGEIHILDSPFYERAEQAAARSRSVNYFHSMDAEEMVPFYHHHLLDDILAFKPVFIRYPHENTVRKWLGKHSSFPWICIRQQN